VTKRNNIIKKKQEITWAEVEVPGGHTLPDGRVIDVNALIPDTADGYGDATSVALLAADLASKESSDSQAGDRAYESALEQVSDTDFKAKRIEIKQMMRKADEPMMELYEDRDAAGVLMGMHVLTNWTAPQGKWDKSWRDPRDGAIYYPRIDYVPIDEMDRVELEHKYGVKV
jgi:hypothetical protein